MWIIDKSHPTAHFVCKESSEGALRGPSLWPTGMWNYYNLMRLLILKQLDLSNI